MARSMTGFGRCEATINGRDIVVEIKSVNHKFFEFFCRTSRGYSFLEERLKSEINSKVSRGKLDVFVSVSVPEDTQANVTVNHNLAAGYVSALKELAQTYDLTYDITASMLSRYPDILTVHKTPEDEDEVWAAVKPALDEALNRYIEMKKSEGERLKADVLGRAERILEIVSKIEERSPQTVKEYEVRLKEKIKDFLQGATVDEQRLLTEVAIFSDKVAVAEETVRLRSHFEELKNALDTDGAVGRRLDFIIQEMNREANTIGSKVSDAELAHRVVDIKVEIEKIREQIQNLE